MIFNICCVYSTTACCYVLGFETSLKIISRAVGCLEGIGENACLRNFHLLNLSFNIGRLLLLPILEPVRFFLATYYPDRHVSIDLINIKESFGSDFWTNIDSIRCSTLSELDLD